MMMNNIYPNTHRVPTSSTDSEITRLIGVAKEINEAGKKFRCEQYALVLDALDALIQVAPNNPTKSQLVNVRTIIIALDRRETTK
jgi:hypothetical protein